MEIVSIFQRWLWAHWHSLAFIGHDSIDSIIFCILLIPIGMAWNSNGKQKPFVNFWDWEDLRFATSRAVSGIWAFPAPLVLRSAPCADSLVLGRFITTFTLVKLTHQSSTKQQEHLLNAALSKGQFWCPKSCFFSISSFEKSSTWFLNCSARHDTAPHVTTRVLSSTPACRESAAPFIRPDVSFTASHRASHLVSVRWKRWKTLKHVEKVHGC